MKQEQVQKMIDDHIDLIVANAKGIAAARERAAMFLVVESNLTTYKKDLEISIVKADAIEQAEYAMGIKQAEGSNITEKKITVADYKPYLKAKKVHASMKAQKSWVNTHIEIFHNAHVLFRQFAHN